MSFSTSFYSSLDFFFIFPSIQSENMYRERFSVSVTIEWLIDSQSLSPHKAEQSN